jgi:hypothetical protein
VHTSYDWIWITGVLIIIFIFGALSIVILITPYSDISDVDGRCHIGMAAVPAYILLALDALINAALTSVFVVLLRPVMRLQDNAARGGASCRPSSTRSMIQMVGWFNIESQETGSTSFRGSRRGILSRNVVGSALIFLASAANLTAFFIDQSIQLGYLCLITCTADSTSSSFPL